MNIPHLGRWSFVESEATAVSSTTDRLIRVDADQPFLVMIELQAGDPRHLPKSMYLRQTLHDHRYGLPVLPVLILLHKSADRRFLTGVYRRRRSELGAAGAAE